MSLIEIAGFQRQIDGRRAFGLVETGQDGVETHDARIHFGANTEIAQKPALELPPADVETVREQLTDGFDMVGTLGGGRSVIAVRSNRLIGVMGSCRFDLTTDDGLSYREIAGRPMEVVMSPGSSGVTVASGVATATGQCERTLQSIQVTPPTPMVVFGTMQRFTATGAYSDGSATLLTDLAAWSSSDTAVATISNAAGSHGLASSVGGGTSTITAMYDGVSGSASLTVISDGLVSIVVTPASPAIAVGMTQQFTAIGHNSDSTTMDLTTLVTWNSSATSVATISNGAGMNGFATAWAVGSTTIQANLGSVSGVASLQVTP